MSPSPQRCPCPNTWKLWIHHLTWQRGIKAADGIKVTNQMSLKWEHYPGLSEWDQYDHKGSEKWGKQLQERVRVMWCEKKTHLTFAGCETGEKCHKWRRAGGLKKLKKAREGILHRAYKKECVCLLSLERPVSDFWPTQLQGNPFVLLIPLSLQQ